MANLPPATPPAETPAPAETPPPAAPPVAPPVALPPVPSIKLEETDQVARDAARRVGLLEEQLAARNREAPQIISGERGFGLRSADNAYVLRIHGILQADARFFRDDTVLQDKDTFLLRRFRPAIDGTLFGLTDFRFVPDLAGGQVQVFDAYIDVHPEVWLRLRVGKFKTPLGLERLQQDADLPFVERALTQNLTPQRDVGASLWGDVADGLFGYSIGIYNGAPDGTLPDVDANYAKDFVGRILIQPFQLAPQKGLGTLGLHLAASTGDRKGLPTNPQLPSFKSAGQNTFFTYIAPATDPSGAGTVFAHLTQSRIDPGLYYYIGPFGLLGEVVWSRQEVQKGNAMATLTHRAAHATASFVLGGKNGYDGVTPARGFDMKTGSLGALEIAVRVNWLKLDDRTFADPNVPGSVAYADITKSASKAEGGALELNYVPTRTLRFAAAYEETTFSGGKAAGADRNTEKVVTIRTQVNF